MTPTPPEAIEAALAFVHRVADLDPELSSVVDEARRIAALLPKPVDEAVLACREILALDAEAHGCPGFAAELRSGESDVGSDMRTAVLVYRAGAASTKGRG